MAAVGGAEIIGGADEEEGGNWGDDADLVLDDEFGPGGGLGDDEG